MSLAIPRFLQARDLIGAAVQGGTLNTSNAIDWGTAVEISLRGSGGLGTIKAYELSSNPSMATFMSSDMVVANNQVEYEDWELTVREIMPNDSMGALRQMALFDYVRVSFAYRPRHWTTGAGARIIAVGARGQYQTGLAVGENVQSLVLKPIGWAIWTGLTTDTPPI